MKTLYTPARMKMRLIAPVVVICCFVFIGSQPAQAQTSKTDPGNNNLPPAGAILDLSGTPIPGGGNSTYQQYTVGFTATLSHTAITFAFRDDPAQISFANASVTDVTIPGGNLLVNGNFSSGNLTGWTYANVYGAQAGGSVTGYPGYCYAIDEVAVNYCWFDGAVQAYDAISQTIATTIGHTYQISFDVAEDSAIFAVPGNLILPAGYPGSDCYAAAHSGPSPCNFSDLSTNGDITNPGGNGINVSVYAQAGLPVGTSQSVNLTFSTSTTPVTHIATIGNPTDNNAQSLALTVASVDPPINVLVNFNYEPTEFSNGGTTGVGIADGVCESGATEATDFDCRLTPNFTYPNTIVPAGDKLVPHIIPSHNNLGVWVRVTATRVSDGMPAVEGVDYSGPIEWYYTWNSNPSLVEGDPPNPAYPPGWNNQNPQMYDRPGENVDIAFVNNITTYSKVCLTTCVGTADPGTGGKTGKLNDIVVAAPPNPPGTADTVEPLVPVPGISPFPYVSGLPMLVAFELENESAETSDGTALTLPHSVKVATLDPTGAPIQVQPFPGFGPTTFTYKPKLKQYLTWLSPAPYKLSDGTPSTVYTLQINSDLFPQPVNATFKVCTLLQVLTRTCP